MARVGAATEMSVRVRAAAALLNAGSLLSRLEEFDDVIPVCDEVVAYAKLSLSRAPPHVAMHDFSGVKRAWRGRGSVQPAIHAS